MALILSDIINDPLDLIASGPTVVDNSTYNVEAILQKYDLCKLVPKSVICTLQDMNKNAAERSTREYTHVQNVIVGNSNIALLAARNCAEEFGYHSVIISNSVQGESSKVALLFSNLMTYTGLAFQHAKKCGGDVNVSDLKNVIAEWTNLPTRWRETILSDSHIIEGLSLRKPVCFIAGGETTVTVNSDGKGGRNQEMALAWAIDISQRNKSLAVGSFLSAGTDGQDGPTDAAGAVVSSCINLPADVQAYLDGNNSYNFWTKLDKEAELHQLIKTGLTGTNVMDIQVLLVEPTSE